MNYDSREPTLIPDVLKKISNIKNSEVYFPGVQELTSFRVVISTLMNSGSLASTHLDISHFSFVIIDEAGQVYILSNHKL